MNLHETKEKHEEIQEEPSRPKPNQANLSRTPHEPLPRGRPGGSLGAANREAPGEGWGWARFGGPRASFLQNFLILLVQSLATKYLLRGLIYVLGKNQRKPSGIPYQIMQFSIPISICTYPHTHIQQYPPTHQTMPHSNIVSIHII